MWNRREIKSVGKAAFQANYWRSLLSAALLSLAAGGAAVGGGSRININIDEKAESFGDALEKLFQGETIGKAFEGISESIRNPWFIALLAGGISIAVVISVLIKIFVCNPLEVGTNRFFRENVPAGGGKLSALKEGFAQYGHVFLTLFLRDLFQWLWGLLFVIPGIIKSYAYRMVPYIVKDEPGLSPREVINRSREMMRGNKWKAFVMDLSFLGWYILGALTFGILNTFWVEPYYQNSKAALYVKLKGEI